MFNPADDLRHHGVPVTARTGGDEEPLLVRVIDWDAPENNDFLLASQFWVSGAVYKRRCDLVGFVNGLPLLFMELKNVNKEIRAAYEQNLADYKDTVPHLLHHNAVIVLANGILLQT